MDGLKGFGLHFGPEYLICACSSGLIRIFNPSTFECLKVMPVPPPIGKTNMVDK